MSEIRNTQYSKSARNLSCSYVNGFVYTRQTDNYLLLIVDIISMIKTHKKTRFFICLLTANEICFVSRCALLCFCVFTIECRSILRKTKNSGCKYISSFLYGDHRFSLSRNGILSFHVKCFFVSCIVLLKIL